MNNKQFGGALLVAGTAIGAGMLGMPLSSASNGFLISLIVMIGCWALSYLSAINLVDLNKELRLGVTYPELAKVSMGSVGARVTYVVFTVMHYAILAAYMDGVAQMLTPIVNEVFGLDLAKINLSAAAAVLIFILIAFRTKLADRANQVLFAAKIALFIFISGLLIPDIHSEYLQSPATTLSLGLIPLMFTSFGFQGSVPAVIDYLKSEPTADLRKVMFVGSTFPLLIYVIWQAVTLGLIPSTGANSFETINSSSLSLPLFFEILTRDFDGFNMAFFAKVFSFFALLTSFIGVGMALYHLIKTSIQHKSSRADSLSAKLVTGLVTFVPPLVVVYIYPKAFIECLAFAGVMLAFIALFVPALARIKLKGRVDLTSLVLLTGFAGILYAEYINIFM